MEELFIQLHVSSHEKPQAILDYLETYMPYTGKLPQAQTERFKITQLPSKLWLSESGKFINNYEGESLKEGF